MAAEYLFSKTYRECFRTYNCAPKHTSWVVRYAFVGCFKSLLSLNEREVSTLWNWKKILFSEFQSYQKAPWELQTVMKDVTLPTRDSIRECWESPSAIVVFRKMFECKKWACLVFKEEMKLVEIPIIILSSLFLSSLASSILDDN